MTNKNSHVDKVRIHLANGKTEIGLIRTYHNMEIGSKYRLRYTKLCPDGYPSAEHDSDWEFLPDGQIEWMEPYPYLS